MSITDERNAARVARNDRVQEVVYLLSWLTKYMDASTAHLAPVAASKAGAASTMNYVVCIHDAADRLCWRISDFEMLEYFTHLRVRDCPPGMSRDDKMVRLAELAARH